MASTIAIYTGDGTTTDFTVPFDYLAKKFVKVSVGLTELEGGDYGDTSKGFYFLDKTTVRLKTAPQAGTEVKIRRYTSATNRVVSFKDASILKASDLDISSVQTTHIAEEGRDVINDALIVDREGNWDAKGNRIVNVGDAVSDGDAVNLKLYKEDAKGAYQSRIEAEKARDRAVEAETNAKESEAKAKVSETNSKMSETVANASAKNSANSASTATQQATLATQKATEAKTNADKAALSKDAAKVSETNAKKSEANAKVSETNSKESELKAKQYADQATAGQAQADWKQTDSTEKDFIKNKPTLGTLSAKNSLAYSELTGVPTSFTPSSHTHPISQITNLQVDLTKIRQSITAVSSKVDGIGDTLSPTYAKKQTILDACDQAMNGANPVHAGDPTLDEIKSALATIQAQLGQLESRRYVKETGKSSDGTSWYRVWSDGWIEQGGTYTSSDNNNYPVTLSKKMTTTNYHSTVTGGYHTASNSGFGYCYDKTTSGFKAVVIEPMGTWYVCGY